MSRWFRYHDEALDDPKVQALPGDLFKVWVNTLCVASRNGGKISEDSLGFLLRIPEAKAAVALQSLIERGLIDRVQDYLEPHNWNARQYKSDVSTDRVKRHRKQHRNVSCNVSTNVSETPTETPPDTETEADSSSSLRSEPRSAPAKAVSASSQGKFIDPLWQPSSEGMDVAIGELGEEQSRREADKFRDYWLGRSGADGRKRDWDATWRNWVRRAAEDRRPKQAGKQNGVSASVAVLDGALGRFGSMDEMFPDGGHTGSPQDYRRLPGH